MEDFFDRLSQRARDGVPVVKPLVPSRFEPAPELAQLDDDGAHSQATSMPTPTLSKTAGTTRTETTIRTEQRVETSTASPTLQPRDTKRAANRDAPRPETLLPSLDPPMRRSTRPDTAESGPPASHRASRRSPAAPIGDEGADAPELLLVPDAPLARTEASPAAGSSKTPAVSSLSKREPASPSRRSRSSGADTIVRVTIGRIEVRTPPPPAAPPSSPPAERAGKPKPRETALSLDAYLTRRNGRR